ncbi:MAG: tetratricopeptide repeat protein [Bacteroidia bacterium]|nr:tetratricopeptide repeat protein [Bacteroidia bacterium]
MRKAILFYFLLLFCNYYALSQPGQEETDFSGIQNPKDIRENIKLLKNLYNHYAFKDPAKAHSYVLKAIDLAEKIHDKSEVQQLYHHMGEIYRANGNYSLAIEYFLRSLSIIKELKMVDAEIFAYNDIGNCYFEINDFDHALVYYQKGILLGKKSPKYRFALAVSLNNEGLVFTQNGDYQMALANHLKGLELRKGSNDFSLLAHSYKSIGIDYTMLNVYDSAEYFLNKSIESNYKIGDSLQLSTVNSLKGELYTINGQFAKADSCFLSAESYFKRQRAYSPLAKMYLRWAESLVKKQQYPKAETLFGFAIENAKIAKADPLISAAYQGLISLLQKTGRNDQAFEHYKKLVEMKDGILTRQMQQAFDLATSQDEIHKLDKQISAAKLDKSKADDKIKAQSFRLRVMLGVSLVGILVFILMLWTALVLRKQNKGLKIATTRAENALKAKSDFLSNMSHEIRTPMNGIVGFTDLLLSENLGIKEREFVQSIKFSADNLMVIINDILDYSKIEAGKLSLEKADFNLHALIKELSRNYHIQSKAKGLHFELKMDDNVPTMIKGDPVRMFQILGNLLNNAIKFTTEGNIYFSIKIDADGKQLSFSVKDSGIGIAPEKQKYIFEKFTQAEENITRIFGGSGLGLPIAKKLAELMEGDILVHSIIGQGSEFTLVIRNFHSEKAIVPVPSAEPKILEEKPKVLTMPTAKNNKVLSVDDNSVNQKIIGLMLKGLGYEVDFAMGGKEALDYIEKNNYLFILMDFHMPEMDGFETTRIIRALNSESKSKTPIMGVSADVFENAKNSAISSGMNAILHKPIKKDDLANLVTEILEKGQAGKLAS